MRALFALFVMVVLRARRRISTLHPRQMVMPATLLQIVIFVVAALTEHFVIGFAVGNFLIAALFMLPLMFRQDEVKVHWVEPEE